MRKFLIAIALALISTPLFGQIKVYSDPNLRLSDDFGQLAEYRPPKVYEKWAKEIADCEQLKPLPKAKFDSLRFQTINAPWFSFDTTFDITYQGAASYKDNAILVSLPHVWDYTIIAHEFLHLILEANFGSKYSPEITKDIHPKQYFTRCNIAPY